MQWAGADWVSDWLASQASWPGWVGGSLVKKPPWERALFFYVHRRTFTATPSTC